MDERFYKTEVFVPATSYEVHCLWRECEGRRTWVQDNSGKQEVIGQIDGRDMRVDFFWNTVDGKMIAFYESVGGVFDSKMMDEWIAKNFPNAKTENAMNFHNIFRG